LQRNWWGDFSAITRLFQAKKHLDEPFLPMGKKLPSGSQL
jgi:hypothetical protein